MAKKILLILAILLSTLKPSFAIEEMVLGEELFSETLQECELKVEAKSLKEKLSDIYHLEIEQIDSPQFLLKDILTKKYDKDSILESSQVWGAYNATLGFDFIDNEKFGANYDISYVNLGVDGKLKNNIGDFRLMLNVSPFANRDFIQLLFADVYIATNQIPNHRLIVGNTRPPVGMEGGYSPYLLPFISRSQISRNFGSVRKLGARISGNYPLVNYDLGIYSSDTYFQSFFPGTEFVGWINLKPLGLTDGKYGKLTLGTGVQTGDRNCSYTVAGAYAGYEYKKMLLNFEWANADGYNGPLGYALNKHATGLYSTLAYRISPKVQALVRYDEFRPDKHFSNKKREYVAGINYFVKGQALKLVLNYVFCQNDATKNSHRIMLGTQILL